MMIIFFDAGIFDVLTCIDKDLSVPITWLKSDAKLIKNLQVAELHSFDTCKFLNISCLKVNRGSRFLKFDLTWENTLLTRL